MKKALRVFGSAAMIMMGGVLPGLAANRTSTTSGDWINNATWGGNPYPTNGDSAYINHGLTITNSEQVSLGSGQWYIGNASAIGSLKVAKSGSVLSSAVGTLGNTHGNSMTVSSNGQVRVAGVFWIGVSRSNNSLTIDSGGVVTNANTFYIAYGDARSNSVLVAGAGSRLDNTVNGIYVSRASSTSANSGFNSLTIADGGAVNSKGAHVGYQVSATYLADYNTALVTDPGSKWTLSGALYVSRGGAGINNVLTIRNRGQAVMTSGSGAITVADTAGATGNGIRLASGGLLEAISSGILLGHAANSGNYVTNSGGILQFASATPTITINNSGGNKIVMDSGTLSFRGLTSTLDLLNRNAGATYEGKFTWQGANKFRLNNSALNNTTAYTFEDTADPKHYAGLEMVDGTTALTANPLTISSTGGSMLFSNTTATVSGAFTNDGIMTMAGSRVTFSSAAVFNGTLIVNLDDLNETDSIITNANLTLGPSSVLMLTGTRPTSTKPFIRFTGSRNGKFGSVTGVPFKVTYTSDSNGVIQLGMAPPQGTLVSIR